MPARTSYTFASLYRLAVAVGLLFCLALPAWAGSFKYKDTPGDMKWPGGRIPYTYKSDTIDSEKEIFEWAARSWQREANLNFVKTYESNDFLHQSPEGNYLLVQRNYLGKDVNFAFIGRCGSFTFPFTGMQPLSINSWSGELVIHEVGHVLGFIHEQQRVNRDNYVTLKWDNINFFTSINWDKETKSTDRTDYDYASIMHYDRRAYAWPWAEGNTMEAKDPTWTDYIGIPTINDETKGDFNNLLSVDDIKAIQAEYGKPTRFEGKVRTSSGLALEGATAKLVANGGDSAHVIHLMEVTGENPWRSDAEGNFVFEGLPTGSYKVRVSKAKYTFSPSEVTLTVGAQGKTVIETFTATVVETTPPALTIDSLKEDQNGVVARSNSLKSIAYVNGSATDVGGSGVKDVRVALRKASGAWLNWNTGLFETATFDFDKHGPTAEVFNAKDWGKAIAVALPEGTYVFYALAGDFANNKSDWKTATFTIDTTKPQLSSNNRSWFDFQSTPPTGTVSDNLDATPGVSFNLVQDLGSGQAYWNGTTWTTNTNDTKIVHLAKVTGNQWAPKELLQMPTRAQMPPGLYGVIVAAKDAAGNFIADTSAMMNRTPVDTTFPDVAIQTPPNNAVYAERVMPAITGTAIDNESFIQGIRLYLMRLKATGGFMYWDGEAWQDAGSYAQYLTVNYNADTKQWQAPGGNFRLPTGDELPDGTYKIQATAFNREVPQATRLVERTFFIGVEPPQVAITSPTHNGFGKSGWSITGTVRDPSGTGFNNNRVVLSLSKNGQFWDGQKWVTTDNPIELYATINSDNTWSYPGGREGESLPLDEGQYAISASVRDKNGVGSSPVGGGVSGANNILFQLDTTPPQLTLGSPVNGLTITSADDASGMWFAGQAQDSNPAQPGVTLYIRREGSYPTYWTGSGWAGTQTLGALKAEYTSGKNWQSATKLPMVGKHDWHCLVNGTYTFIAIAQDAAGNSIQKDATVTVNVPDKSADAPFFETQTAPISPDGVTAATALTYAAGNTDTTGTPSFVGTDANSNLYTGVQRYSKTTERWPSTVVFKHDASGNVVWKRERELNSITVTSGNQQTTTYYERYSPGDSWSPIAYEDFTPYTGMSALTTDAAGNTYVALSLSTPQSHVISYNASGSANYATRAYSNGRVVLVKFDSTGAVVWRTSLGQGGSDSWNNVVSVKSIRPLSDGSAALLINNIYYYYDSYYSVPTTNAMAVARVGSASSNFLRHFGKYTDLADASLIDLGVDAADNIYVASNETEKVKKETFRVLRKLNSAGQVARTVTLPGCHTPEGWMTIRVDRATGAIYTAGGERMNNDGAYRMVLTKYDLGAAVGAEQQWRSYGPAGSCNSETYVQIQLADSGITLAATGNATGESNADYYVSVARFNTAGTLLWAQKNDDATLRYTGSGSRGVSIANLLVDSTGSAFVIGQGSKHGLIKFASNGDLQFIKPFPDNFYSSSSSDRSEGKLLMLANGKIAALADPSIYSSSESTVITFTNPAYVSLPLTVPAEDPADQTTEIGGSALFTVHNSGSPATYQWHKDGMPIAGATKSSLLISPVTIGNEGSYSVVLTSTVKPSDVVTTRSAKLKTFRIVPLAEALGNSNLAFTTGGAGPAWFGQTGVSNSGGSAAQVRSGTSGQKSNLETTVTGPGTLSFYWNINGLPFEDYLYFYVDDDFKLSNTGNSGWYQRSVEVPAGQHTLRWVFQSAYGQRNTVRSAWVDDVVFTPAQPIVIPEGQPDDQEVVAGQFFSLSVNVTGTSPTYQWFKDGEPIVGETYPELYIYDAATSDAGEYFVQVSNALGMVQSRTATVSIVTSLPPDTESPTLESLSVAPASVDVSTADGAVKVRARLKDNRGIFYASVVVQQPNGSASYYNMGSSDIVSGGGRDGTYEISIPVTQQASAGLRTITSIAVRDFSGNVRTYGTGAYVPYPAGSSSSYTVINPNSDSTGPALSSLAFTPTQVDVSTADRTIAFSAAIVDSGSGFTNGFARFQSPSGRNVTAYFGSSNRTSGTAQNGMYSFNATIRQYMEAGTWKLSSVSLTDASNNTSVYSTTGTPFPAGTNSELAVKDTNPDTKASTLASMSFSPASADVRDAAVAVTATVRITDAPSGVSSGSLVFYSPSNGQYLYATLTRSSGTPQDGIYSATITVPKGAEAGQWKPMLQITDAVGNYVAYFADTGTYYTPYPKGVSAGFTVINGVDTLNFSQPAYTITQEGPVATITVTRVNASASTVSVKYATSDGTAKAGKDYTAKSGTLSFKPAEISKTFTIPIKDDDSRSFTDEILNLTLSEPTGGAILGGRSGAILTIRHNDGDLSKATSGNGQIVDKVAGTYRESGKSYSVMAKPDDGWLFDGWSGVYGLTEAQRLNPSLTFVMTQDLDLKASFVQNLFPPAAGSYTGLVSPGAGSPIQAGLLKITSTATPAFTGKLTLEGATFTFSKAAFRNDGSLTYLLVRPSDKKVLNFMLQLNLNANGPRQITGWLYDGTTQLATVTARQEVTSKTVSPALVGSYTFGLPFNLDGSSRYPTQTYGPGTMSVSKNGLATMKSTMGDGSTIIVTQNLTGTNVIPFYSYKSGVCVAGTAVINTSTRALTGSQRWWRAGQPTLTSSVIGSPYAAPGAEQNIIPKLQETAVAGKARLAVASYDVNESLDDVVITNGAVPKVMLPTSNPRKLALTFTGKDGSFKGSFTPVGTTQKVSFTGVVIQNQNLGVGYFKKADGSVGYIDISPIVPANN